MQSLLEPALNNLLEFFCMKLMQVVELDQDGIDVSYHPFQLLYYFLKCHFYTND